MTERPLNEYIDLEAYDVVDGQRYRDLRDALLMILVRIEDANQPYERLAIGAIARAALYPEDE